MQPPTRSDEPTFATFPALPRAPRAAEAVGSGGDVNVPQPCDGRRGDDPCCRSTRRAPAPAEWRRSQA